MSTWQRCDELIYFVSNFMIVIDGFLEFNKNEKDVISELSYCLGEVSFMVDDALTECASLYYELHRELDELLDKLHEEKMLSIGGL